MRALNHFVINTLLTLLAGAGARARAPQEAGLGDARAVLADALLARAAGDAGTARELVVEAIGLCFESGLSEQEDDASVALLEELGNLAHQTGELRAAERARRQVLEVRERTRSPLEATVLRSRLDLVQTLEALGEIRGMLALDQELLAALEAADSADSHLIESTRLNIAQSQWRLGDLAGARASFESALAALETILPPDDYDVQIARMSLAGTLAQQGDLAGARALAEMALAAFERTRPPDHPDVQMARQNLGACLYALGDFAGSLALGEAVLEVAERTLSPDHIRLQAARQAVAVSRRRLGDDAGARPLEEAVLEVLERTLTPDHPDLALARGNLAGTLFVLGDLERSRALFEAVLETRQRTLPDDHPELQKARQRVASVLAAESLVLLAAPDRAEDAEIEAARMRERCSHLLRQVCDSQRAAVRSALLVSSAREAEARCAAIAQSLSALLSFASGYGDFEALDELIEPAFTLCESVRVAGLASARIGRRAREMQDYAHSNAELQAASEDLARLARQGTTSEEYHRARSRRESAEREMLRAVGGAESGIHAAFELDLVELGRGLSPREVLVGYTRTNALSLEPSLPPEGAKPRVRERSVASLFAFVLHGAGEDEAPRLTLVPLGPLAPIDAAVRSWREGIGARFEETGGAQASPPGELRGIGLAEAAASDARARGVALRRLVWDPLIPALADAERAIVASDDLLLLVPLDALPLEEGEELLGDRWRIESRLALWELLHEPPPAGAEGALVALGGATFDAPPEPSAAVSDSPAGARAAAPESDSLRATDFEAGFAALEHTGPEVREIAGLFASIPEMGAEPVLLQGRHASRQALARAGQGARWLHIATHGWFAPESVRSWSDLDEEHGALAPRARSEEVVRGMSPMLLCGLALAGANLPADALGRVPGLITAEELSTLDLANCELAVLSACDTNVGERRAGQGVASLQKALHMAGARSVITSLWKVPDEATRELMLDFYRRTWLEKKPKSQALWEAKKRLRDARDERGEPLYTTRDWAAWILTGEPD